MQEGLSGGYVCGGGGVFSHHQSREQIGEPVGGYQNAYISSKAYEVDVVFSGGDPRTHLNFCFPPTLFLSSLGIFST